MDEVTQTLESRDSLKINEAYQKLKKSFDSYLTNQEEEQKDSVAVAANKTMKKFYKQYVNTTLEKMVEISSLKDEQLTDQNLNTLDSLIQHGYKSEKKILDFFKHGMKPTEEQASKLKPILERIARK